MTRLLAPLLAASLFLVAVASPIRADDTATPTPDNGPAPSAPDAAAPNPSPDPASSAQTLTATVVAVQGMVQVRTADDQPWQPATVGMVLHAGAEFRTGPRSRIQFAVPPDQLITLDRLGTVKLLELLATGPNQVKTDVGMRYGRTTYEVQAAGVDHDASIRTPAATLSIRGTVSFGADYGRGYGGRFFTQDTDGTLFVPVGPNGPAKKIAFGGKSKTQSLTDQADSVQDQNQADGGSQATLDRAKGEVDTRLSRLDSNLFGGVSDRNGQFVENFRSLDEARQIADRFDDAAPPDVPGVLSFIVTWNSDTDLDMYVVTPLGEGITSYTATGIPAGTPAVLGPVSRFAASGGSILFDDTDGLNPTTGTDRFGREAANWDGEGVEPPSGTYRVGAKFFSGDPTVMTITTYLNGQRFGTPFTSSISSGFRETLVNIPGPENPPPPQ